MQQSHPAVPPQQNSLRKTQTRPIVLLIVGVLAILISLGVRNSSWARERMLKNLSLEQLALAIRDEPNDSLTFLYYGNALITAGNAQEAEQAFKRASELNPGNERAVLGMASARFRMNKLDDALEAFKKATVLNPKDKEALLGVAQTLYRQGYVSHATEPLKKILELDPRSGPAWYFLGKMYGDTHESDLALDALKHAVQVDPNKAIYWRDLGQLERHYAHLPEAEEDFKKAIHFAQNDPESYLWLGQLYLQMGDTPKIRGQAEQCFQSAIARDPQIEEAYFGLGQLYQRSANYPSAIANYRKATELDSSDEKALHYLGESLVRNGQTAEGQKLLGAANELETAKRDVDYLQKRILAEPKSRDLRLRMARLYRKYENDRSALQQYAAYQNLGSEDTQVRAEMTTYENELIKRGVLPPRPMAGLNAAPNAAGSH